jgi:repressor LexA
MDTIDRIINLITQNGISGAKMSRDLGFSNAVFTQWKQRKQNLSASSIKKIADYFDVSVDYLLGKTDIKKPPTISERSNIRAIYSENIRMVPVFESASAGFGVLACSNVIEYIPLYIKCDDEAENTLCITVTGDSMYPKIEDGDIIQVLKQTSVDSGSIAVVLLDNEEGLVKRVVYGDTWIELQSINPEYKTKRFEGREVLRLQVVGLVKKIIKNCN